MRRKPDFIGIGVQKGGTSWLAACLDAHPNLRIPVKEMGFFTKWFEKGPEMYEEKLGRGTPDDVLVGEFSTTYFHTPGCADLVHSLYPDAKIILVLRDPIERAESVVRHMMMRGWELDMLKTLEWSHYADRLEEWLERFPDMRIIEFKHMRRFPWSHINSLYADLGVGVFHPSILHTKINRSTYPIFICVQKLFDYLGKWRYDLLCRCWWWSAWAVILRDCIKRANSIDFRFTFSEQTRNNMREVLKDDIKRTKELLNGCA